MLNVLLQLITENSIKINNSDHSVIINNSEYSIDISYVKNSIASDSVRAGYI